MGNDRPAAFQCNKPSLLACLNEYRGVHFDLTDSSRIRGCICIFDGDEPLKMKSIRKVALSGSIEAIFQQRFFPYRYNLQKPKEHSRQSRLLAGYRRSSAGLLKCLFDSVVDAPESSIAHEYHMIARSRHFCELADDLVNRTIDFNGLGWRCGCR